jgi:IclR family transcriptional regulator, acetate operon repressor
MARAADQRRPTGAPVQAVSRTMETLELLVGARQGMTVAQLAQALGVEKSIASRLLASLLADGYLIRNSEGERYELSLRLISLASRHADRIGFPAVCQPVLQALSEETGELAQLSVAERDELVLAAHAQSRKRGVAILPTLGTNVTPHATASGKAWLAGFDDDRAIEIALGHGLRALTPLTITSIDKLLAELRKVRADGFATATGEFVEEVSALALPIGMTRFGRVIGTVAVSAPTSRINRDDRDQLEAIRRAAAELEAIWPSDAVRLAG